LRVRLSRRERWGSRARPVRLGKREMSGLSDRLERGELSALPERQERRERRGRPVSRPVSRAVRPLMSRLTADRVTRSRC
jgi:hypothetical protein